MMDIFEILRQAREIRASDVHLIAGSPPITRVDGELEALPEAAPLSAAAIDAALASLAEAAQVSAFQRDLEMDFGRRIEGVGRVRGNAARQHGTTSLVFRLLPERIPNLEDLGLPKVCRELIRKKRGMIIVSGATGSGKSTTLAAMLAHLSDVEARRIVTIEDPIEYVYNESHGAITQRELGRDTRSFAEALKHILRQDPDVILIGEMRDTETAAAALSIAETGHLVLSTGHATSAYQAVERVVDLFPPDEREMAGSRLASVLVGILCQVLVPRAGTPGRAVAVEVMLANPAVRNLIREGKIYQIPNTMRTNQADGMQLLDQALVKLYKEGLISQQNLLAFAQDKDQISRTISAGGLATGGY